mmetsp:Transcript_771/g.1870  ORF Transcript_771/g.1870 Transcript_771/m.1870 type:complete len:200 (-) Transcript_771:1195-1794(-)
MATAYVESMSYRKPGSCRHSRWIRTVSARMSSGEGRATRLARILAIIQALMSISNRGASKYESCSIRHIMSGSRIEKTPLYRFVCPTRRLWSGSMVPPSGRIPVAHSSPRILTLMAQGRIDQSSGTRIGAWAKSSVRRAGSSMFVLALYPVHIMIVSMFARTLRFGWSVSGRKLVVSASLSTFCSVTVLPQTFSRAHPA